MQSNFKLSLKLGDKTLATLESAKPLNPAEAMIMILNELASMPEYDTETIKTDPIRPTSEPP